MQYNFKTFFEKLGVSVIAELRSLMLRQKGVDGGAYAKLDVKTIQRKQKTGSLTPEKRMFDTKDFWGKAFNFQASANSVVVYISKALHGRKLRSMTRTQEKYKVTGNKKYERQKAKVSKLASKTITFEKLAEVQNEEGKSLFFPVTVNQVNNLQSVQRAIPEFKREVIKQTREMFPELCKMKVYNI
jgi:hypothetical protein